MRLLEYARTEGKDSRLFRSSLSLAAGKALANEHFALAADLLRISPAFAVDAADRKILTSWTGADIARACRFINDPKLIHLIATTLKDSQWQTMLKGESNLGDLYFSAIKNNIVHLLSLRMQNSVVGSGINHIRTQIINAGSISEMQTILQGHHEQSIQNRASKQATANVNLLSQCLAVIDQFSDLPEVRAAINNRAQQERTL
jgi:hypothetical protein